MTVVVDASAVVAALVMADREGEWAEALLTSDDLAAPPLLPVKTANVLRRAALAGDISTDVASLAHADLADLAIEYFPYEMFADRVWELSSNVTTYDAWYVAVAEFLDAPLATLDSRLTNAAGPRCRFLVPRKEM